MSACFPRETDIAPAEGAEGAPILGCDAAEGFRAGEGAGGGAAGGRMAVRVQIASVVDVVGAGGAAVFGLVFPVVGAEGARVFFVGAEVQRVGEGAGGAAAADGGGVHVEVASVVDGFADEETGCGLVFPIVGAVGAG